MNSAHCKRYVAGCWRGVNQRCSCTCAGCCLPTTPPDRWTEEDISRVNARAQELNDVLPRLDVPNPVDPQPAGDDRMSSRTIATVTDTLPRMTRLTQMGALKIADPAKWKIVVMREMKLAKGRIPVAAKALEVSVRQLSRWLAEYPEIPRCGPGRPWPEKDE